MCVGGGILPFSRLRGLPCFQVLLPVQRFHLLTTNKQASMSPWMGMMQIMVAHHNLLSEPFIEQLMQ
jgi:hypothetical protein